MAHDLILSRAKLGTFMLTTYPDIYAAQRHYVAALDSLWLRTRGCELSEHHFFREKFVRSLCKLMDSP